MGDGRWAMGDGRATATARRRRRRDGDGDPRRRLRLPRRSRTLSRSGTVVRPCSLCPRSRLCARDRWPTPLSPARSPYDVAGRWWRVDRAQPSTPGRGERAVVTMSTRHLFFYNCSSVPATARRRGHGLFCHRGQDAAGWSDAVSGYYNTIGDGDWPLPAIARSRGRSTACAGSNDVCRAHRERGRRAR